MATIATELLEAKKDERGRRITPAAEYEALVRAYPESGLTQKAFAKKAGVKYSTFVSWVKAQRRRRQRPKVGFTELTLPRPRTIVPRILKTRPNSLPNFSRSMSEPIKDDRELDEGEKVEGAFFGTGADTTMGFDEA